MPTSTKSYLLYYIIAIFCSYNINHLRLVLNDLGSNLFYLHLDFNYIYNKL